MQRATRRAFSAPLLWLVVFAACSGRTHRETEYVTRDGGSETSGRGGAGDTDPGAGGAAETGGDAGAAGNSDSSGSGGGDGSSGASGAGTGGATGREVMGDLLYIKASNPDAADSFGETVALDGNWLAVGAPNEASRATGIDGEELDDSEDRSGAVYLYSDEGRGWAQRAYVKASNSEAVDGFGYALALSGIRLAVGAPYEDSPATGIDGEQTNGDGGNHGAVYVFVRQDDVWQQEAYVKASNTGSVDAFGTSIDLERDILVVGAPSEDSGATTVDGVQNDESLVNSGAVYVFENGADGWAQTAYLKGAFAEADDAFGTALSMSGDTIVVGAPGESSSATGVDPVPMDATANNSGAVYVFERDGASYRQTAFLKASNTDADDKFGGYLALDGDTLAVAAVGEATLGGDGSQSNDLAPDSGAVYVFVRSAGVWEQVSYLKPTGADERYYFGAALALQGDTLVVGALLDSVSTRAGAVYIFQRTTDGFELDERRTQPGAEANDRFGAGVALTPTLLAIGADGEGSDSPGINGDATNDRTPGAGAVFLYRR